MDKEDNKKIVRDSITELLMENDIDVNNEIDEKTLTFARTPSTVTQNNALTLDQARGKAKKVMESLLKIYLSENFISRNEYVQAKVNLDAMTLGNIINQMEISQRAIQILMDNIELGDVNPKFFDALGKLQGTFIDLVKAQTNYIISASDEYEKIALDKEDGMDISTSTAREISSGFKSNSQKDLMRLIRKASESNDKQ